MRNYIYKVIIATIAVIIVFEFTIGRKFNQIDEISSSFLTKEGRKESIIHLREEIKKGVNKDRYLSPEDAQLLNKFFKKIQKEINEVNN